MKILEIYKKLTSNFPKTIDDIWFAGYRKGEEFKRAGVVYGTCIFPFFKDGEYVSYSEGDKVDVIEKDGWIATYKIERIEYPSGMADLAMWDDGKSYWLKLASVRKA